MGALRILMLFIFAALLPGCDTGNDVKELKNEVTALKKDFSDFKQDVKEIRQRAIPVFLKYMATLSPCKAPGEHSAFSCAYKLTIIDDSKKPRYRGSVPETVIMTEDKDCHDNRKNQDECPTSGDTAEHVFTIDGAEFQKGDVVECTASDPTTDHLKNCKKVNA